MSTNSSADNALWYFKQSADDADTYYLVNKAFSDKMVGPTLGVEVRSVMADSEENAGVFRITSTTQGLSSIRCVNPTNTSYAYMHLAGDLNRIVPWLANSPAANAASFWYIEPTDIITDVKSVTDGLGSLISAPEVCYDLNGRVVDLPQKGQIYIRRGRKFVNK